MNQDYIFLNDNQILKEWEKLSFTLFNDDLKEMERFIEFNKNILCDNTSDNDNDIKELLGNYEKSKLDFIKYLMFNSQLLPNVDQNTFMLINKDISESNNDIPPLPRLMRYIGNRIDFNHLWKNRNSGIYDPNVISRLFYFPCVYPNVLKSLSNENLLELTEERYPEKIKLFLINFKKENSILRDMFCDSIFLIIIDYVQPIKYIK